jgi:hypothetical protein
VPIPQDRARDYFGAGLPQCRRQAQRVTGATPPARTPKRARMHKA